MRTVSVCLAALAALAVVSAVPAPAPSLKDVHHNCYADLAVRSLNRLRRRAAEFGYEGDNGPLFWADLNPENALCRTGTLQSPINFAGDAFRVQGTPFTLGWQDSIEKSEFLNEGVTAKMELREPKVSKLTFQGVDFPLEQFHFHTPSEHHFDERTLDAEIHFVHMNQAGNLLVLAVTVEVDNNARENAFFQQINANLPIGAPDTKREVERLDLTAVKQFISTATWNAYVGSLTTPPCLEGVQFIVSRESIKIPLAQLDSLKQVVPFNARFTQRVNGRVAALGVNNVASAPVQEISSPIKEESVVSKKKCAKRAKN